MLEIGKQIIHLSTVDSTNNYAANMILSGVLTNGAVILADEQTNGRGQRMTQWQSQPGMNLTCSIVLMDPSINPTDQFRLSKFVSVGICSFLAKKGISASIKWPNDIYVGNKKICGILIENSLRGGIIKWSIIGIGLNVNQLAFGSLDASSIRLETGAFTSVNDCLMELCASLNENEDFLSPTESDLLDKEYLSRLYMRDVEATFENCTSNLLFRGTIKGVDATGRLIIECATGTAYFDLKEVRLLMQNDF